MTTTTFAELGVSDVVVESLGERGITDAFPIQVATIQAALSGRDICGKAPTGSGKTLAFGIPVVDLAGGGKNWRPRALILAPTRELATQIKEELLPLAKAQGRTIITVFGGTNIEKDIRRLEKGVDILVACPGRLEDLIARRCCELRDVDMVVVDEADRMADMGFLPSVKRLLDQTNSDRHTLLFSATLDGDVDMLIKRYQKDPLTFEVEEAIGDIGDVEHTWHIVQPNDRIGSAVRVLQSYDSSIVFCRTRRGCDRVAKTFVKKGLPAVAIHGDRSQGQRERALADFTSGKAQVLVATDVAARGIHVDNVSLVMHYDPAGSDKDYIHRSGRTGRAGQDGRVISMVVEDKKKIARQLQKELGMRPGFDDLDLSALPPKVVRAKRAPERKPESTPQPQRSERKERKDRDEPRREGRSKNERGGRDRGNARQRQDRDGRGRNDRGSASRGSNTRGRGRPGDKRDDRGGRSAKQEGSRRPRPRPGSNDWFPPGYHDDDGPGARGGRGKPGSKKRTQGGSRGRDNERSRDEEPTEPPTGGSGTTKRKNRGDKGRHADKLSTKNKGKRRGPRK